MKRDTVHYVLPLGEVWLVRAIGAPAEVYPTLEDALAQAERLAMRGARVRVLSPEACSRGPTLARTNAAVGDASPPARVVAS
jgi:hypothetical protein